MAALSEALMVTLSGDRTFTESTFGGALDTPSMESVTVGTIRSPDEEVRLVLSQPARAAASAPNDNAPGAARRTK
jgi:hypothetical protein